MQRRLFQSSSLYGGISSPPKKKITIPQTAAKLCDLNLFFGQSNELYKYVTETFFYGP